MLHLCKVLMQSIDTNSIMYKIEAQSVYESFYKEKEFFEFSNYLKS